MPNKYAILGYPLKHTMSPPIHERLFKLAGINDAEYEVLETPPEALSAEVTHLNSLNGYNITIPFKVDIIGFIDKLDASAERYNAVNCVDVKNGVRTGYNTDCVGFLRALEAGGAGLDGRVLQLGCGGAGRMMAIEAVLHGAELTVAVKKGRECTVEPVFESVKKHCPDENALSRIHVVSIDEINGEFDLLVNSTPVGMFPNNDFSPVDEEIVKRCGCVFDAIYNPDTTKLMHFAEKNGIKALGGMTMLVWQAVVAHEIWNGSAYTESDINALIDDMKKLMR